MYVTIRAANYQGHLDSPVLNAYKQRVYICLKIMWGKHMLYKYI